MRVITVTVMQGHECCWTRESDAQVDGEISFTYMSWNTISTNSALSIGFKSSEAI